MEKILMVGGMGHTAMTALSMSKFSRNKIICLDGDGSFIMHMGALSIIIILKQKF